jgi:hypothetical protein
VLTLWRLLCALGVPAGDGGRRRTGVLHDPGTAHHPPALMHPTQRTVERR